ncbi:DUF3253 domain-containing protein [Glutamicibacter creatinolyticus]|uniref:DUF3253 domain-containing protein n=1 Tax=Glutamicibacter creatinolyticus TaxID=162496 RepID=UPI003217E439
MTSNENQQTTSDGHYIIVNGRKWRASDPAIPAKLRQELVDELMSARRGVKAQEPDARARVQDAKVALGERGEPWWDPSTTAGIERRIAAAIRSLLRKREGSSACPSEIAKIVRGEGGQWRQHMDQVRQVAFHMAHNGELVVTQKGKPVELESVRGPIRLARHNPL